MSGWIFRRPGRCAPGAGRAGRPVVAAILVLVGLATSAAGAQILELDAAQGIAVTNGQVTSWTNQVGAGQVFASDFGNNPSFLVNAVHGRPAVGFNEDGPFAENQALTSHNFGTTSQELTVVLVAAPTANFGNYGGLLSTDAGPGTFDARVGFNVDQRSPSTPDFRTLNVEGAKGGDDTGVNLKTDSQPFGTFVVLTVTYSDVQAQLFVNGRPEGIRPSTPGRGGNPVALRDVRIGARSYGGEYNYFTGEIAEVQIYDTALTAGQRRDVELALGAKYGIGIVPEPASVLLFAVGGIGLAGLGLRRRAPRA